MELQASYTPARHFTSECRLPEIPETAVYAATCVVAAPDDHTPEQLRLAVVDLVHAAGLPAMSILATTALSRHGVRSYHVLAYDTDPARNPLDLCTAYGLASTLEGVLCALATQLMRWAMSGGLLDDSPAYAGKELATC